LAESLSLVLPVHNVQTELQRSVAVLLDVLPELTRDFEILIVDDHSTDSTEEVAYELTRAYPQVRLLRHTRPLGGEVSVETGLARAVGEVVIVLFDLQSSVEKLRHLWEQRAEPTPTHSFPGSSGTRPWIDPSFVHLGPFAARTRLGAHGIAERHNAETCRSQPTTRSCQ
jgi:hypothetical protein